MQRDMQCFTTASRRRSNKTSCLLATPRQRAVAGAYAATGRVRAACMHVGQLSRDALAAYAARAAVTFILRSTQQQTARGILKGQTQHPRPATDARAQQHHMRSTACAAAGRCAAAGGLQRIATTSSPSPLPPLPPQPASQPYTTPMHTQPPHALVNPCSALCDNPCQPRRRCAARARTGPAAHATAPRQHNQTPCNARTRRVSRPAATWAASTTAPPPRSSSTTTQGAATAAAAELHAT